MQLRDDPELLREMRGLERRRDTNPDTLYGMMSLIFEQIRTGGDRNFGYLLADRDARQAVLIDPSYSPEVLVERANSDVVKKRFAR